MTDIHLLDEFTRVLTRTYPSEITLAISAVGGLRIHFAVPIETTVNSWEGAVIEFVDGACAGLSYVVGVSDIQTVIVTSPFFSRKPSAGDTVRIHGGPLAETRIFNEDPETLLEAVNQGLRFFITVTVLAGSIAWKGLGGRSNKGIEATQRVYGFEATAETKLVTGMPTVEDMYREFTALPILKEQLGFLIQVFRVDAQNRLSGDGDIEWTRGFIQRAGHAPMRAYVTNFDLMVN